MTEVILDDDVSGAYPLDDLLPEDDDLLIRPEDFDDEFPFDILAA